MQKSALILKSFLCQLIINTIHDVDSDDGENDCEKEDDEKDG